eukprot:393624_1
MMSHTEKYAEIIAKLKCEERILMNERIQCINTVLTEKCKLLSGKVLAENFSFGFEFPQMHQYLSTIDKFGKKRGNDPLTSWWINQSASEMSKTFLPCILDKIDQVSHTISKQTKSKLRSKLEKYIQFELLETALTATFKRPR